MSYRYVKLLSTINIKKSDTAKYFDTVRIGDEIS